jgi:hypothetical protein
MSVLIPLHCVSRTHQPHTVPFDDLTAAKDNGKEDGQLIGNHIQRKNENPKEDKEQQYVVHQYTINGSDVLREFSLVQGATNASSYDFFVTTHNYCQHPQTE